MMTSLLLMLAASMSTATINEPLPFLSPMFGDHMVLQRDKRNTFWGWTKPGEKVRVTIGGKSASGVADDTGKWVVKLNPPPVGGPYSLKVQGSQQVELQDILVGDVWLCTGQSNMEMGLSQALNGKAEVASADEPQIRLYMAPRQYAYAPKAINAAAWKVCTSKTVGKDGWGGFSAVGYFFGRELQHKLQVPVGLVAIAWGGTSAEAWTSAGALRPLSDFNTELDQLEALQQAKADPIGTYNELWITQHNAGTLGAWQKPESATSDWKATTLANGFADLGMSGKKGVVWFRTTVDLAMPPTGETATIALGRIQTADTVWVNGTKVGSSNGQGQRVYIFASALLKSGQNVVAIQVFNTRGKGGFAQSSTPPALKLADGTRIDLAGTWLGKVGGEIKQGGPMPKDGEPNPTIPTVLMNGMIAPVSPMAIRGAIWYQGETNSGRSYQYRRLLPAMIADWRKLFGQGDFPFYIVSLAAWKARLAQPSEDGWTELREAQAMTAAKVRHSGIAITTDIGDAIDVHPKDKKTVGERLALIALANEFHEKIEFSGPTYKRMKVEGNSIRLSFDHVDKGLVAKGGELVGFAVAGDDRKWHWAKAKIDGETILVSSPEVPKPIAARFAWAANPDCNLYNTAGLPAIPFRTDDWKGVTADNK